MLMLVIMILNNQQQLKKKKQKILSGHGFQAPSPPNYNHWLRHWGTM